MENQKDNTKKEENEMQERREEAAMQPFNSIHSQEGADDSEGEQNNSQGEHPQVQTEGVQGDVKGM
jgi:hypothetical protein